MQKQIEAYAQLPIQIQHMAETQHMGECLAVHPRNYKTYPFLIALGITLFIGLTAIVLPLTALSWASYLLGLLLLALAIYLSLLRARIVHRQDLIVIYAEGFISFNGGTPTPFRWETIESVQRGTAPGEGQTIGDIDRITVRAGEKHFKLYPNMPKHARADICDRIERNFVSTHLPQMIGYYHAGEEIHFGTLAVSQAGFRDATDRLPWPMVEKVQVGPTLVIIRKEGRTSDWYHQLVCNIPNAALLQALLEQRQ